MKEFFGIVEPYRFEWGDLSSLAMVINVTLVITIGFLASWFGILVATVGLVRDFTTTRHINVLVMHIASFILNAYFLGLFYQLI
jgi:hypothetical protein